MIFSKFQTAPFSDNNRWTEYWGWDRTSTQRYDGWQYTQNDSCAQGIFVDGTLVTTNGVNSKWISLLNQNTLLYRTNNMFAKGFIKGNVSVTVFQIISRSRNNNSFYTQTRQIAGYEVNSAFLKNGGVIFAIAVVDCAGINQPTIDVFDINASGEFNINSDTGVLYYIAAEVPSEDEWWAHLESDLYETTEAELADNRFFNFNQPSIHGNFESSFSCSVATPPKSTRVDVLQNCITHSCVLPDVFDAGLAYIAGKVTVENITPVSRKVRLYDLNNGRLVGETWSDDDGNYRFSGLVAGKRYFAVAHDHTEVYNAAIQDRITADDG